MPGSIIYPRFTMCKRAVERYNNEPKRARSTQPVYTQGPLDEVFGQHSAFPLDAQATDDDDNQVYQYLANVRSEAENDRVCYFVERDSKNDYFNSRSTQFNSTEPGSSPLTREYTTKIMNKLEAEKQKLQNNETANGQTFSLGEIDFSTDDTIEDAQHHSGERNSPGPDSDSFTTETNGTPSFGPQRSYQIPESAAKWRDLVFKNPAPPQEYFQDVLEHPTIIKLIVYYTKWLSASMPESLADWIFSTFVRLDCGLDHQEIALVRAFGVKAQKLRAKFLEGAATGTSVSESAQSCVDMILAVVSQYFGQRDLVSIA